MSETDKEADGLPPVQDLPEVAVSARRSLSIVWLIPVVAALIGAWLAYKTLSEQGPTVTITFKEGIGLEAGKTKIKYKALEVGVVDAIRLSQDLSQLIVTAKLNKDVEAHLGEGTKFWVVRPRVGLSGVSGLETLFSGTYIEVEFGDGGSNRAFTGLEQPPRVKADTPGRQYLLLADKLGSLQRGSPVYYRDIQVGEVLSTGLAEQRGGVLVHIFVNAPYHLLVHDNSRFWKVGGFEVSLGAQGIDVKMESLLSLLSGGVAFDSPDIGGQGDEASEDGTRFRLFDSFASITEASYTEKNAYILYFEGSVRGLNRGAPVEFKGIRVGTVVDVSLDIDPATMNIRIPVVIEVQPQRFLKSDELNQYSEIRHVEREAGRRLLMEKLVERGLRAQLRTGSLLTGQLYVDLDIYPDSPAKKLVYGGQHPEIPTVPATLEAFQKTAMELVAQLRKLPLDKIGDELLGTAQGANRLVNSPDLKAAIRSLDGALKNIAVLSQTADRQVATLAASTEKTLGTVRTALETVKTDGPLLVDLGNMLEELAAAARSIRALSDYLERHPEALLYGKGGPGAK